MSNPALILDDDADTSGPQPGIGLCLSGGGYRAMIFHVGMLLRLNEVGLLRKLDRVSSVSGGSITAAILGLEWKQLDFQAGTEGDGVAANLRDLILPPIRRMAAETIDRESVLGGILIPGVSISDIIVSNYRRLLFGDATLQDLPAEGAGPRFIINATNVQSGSLVRFSRPYLADYRVGMIRHPKIALAVAVAASSAFPPVLSPATVDVNPADFEVGLNCPLGSLPYTDTMVLSDGGVYDNLGLESVIKRYQTVLVSDAGGKIAPVPEPASNWAEHSKRVLDIIDDQVRSLRKRALIEAYRRGDRTGAYWGIRTDIANYGLDGALAAPHDKTMLLAETPTRLKALATATQNRLINWGYAVCDAALRKHVPDLLRPGSAGSARYPFSGGVG